MLVGWHRTAWKNQVGMDAWVNPEADSDGDIEDLLN